MTILTCHVLSGAIVTLLWHSYGSAKYIIAGSSSAQRSTAQHSTAQHSAAQRSTAQRSTVQTLRSSTLSRFKIMEYVRRNWLSSLVALPVIILRTSPSSGTCDPTQALTTLFLLPNKAVTINIQHATHCCRVSLQRYSAAVLLKKQVATSTVQWLIVCC